jgi:hypothetical protein
MYVHINRSTACISVHPPIPTATPSHDTQDAIVLDRCLDEVKDDLNKALPLYSKRRGPEAKALVEFQVRA